MSRKVLLLSALLVATPSFACAGELVRSQAETTVGTVALADLDLSNSTDLVEARRRLTRMSEHLCHQFRDERKVDDWENYVSCVHSTLASALERLRVSMLAYAVKR